VLNYLETDAAVWTAAAFIFSLILLSRARLLRNCRALSIQTPCNLEENSWFFLSVSVNCNWDLQLECQGAGRCNWDPLMEAAGVHLLLRACCCFNKSQCTCTLWMYVCWDFKRKGGCVFVCACTFLNSICMHKNASERGESWSERKSKTERGRAL